MERILVSACLIGWPVRWDGAARPFARGTDAHDLLARWAEEGRLVPLCPEVAAGLSTPRPAVEIAAGHTAAEVLAGTADVTDAAGASFGAEFREGARIAAATARVRGCRFALLTDGSPSCGVTRIADGAFSGAKRPGEGVVAHALRAAGLEVFADPEALALRLAEVEA